MKLAEAIRISSVLPDNERELQPVSLICGFTPLHLATFLKAYGHLRLPASIRLDTGVYGDLAGNLERAVAGPGTETAVVIEWPDLDPRLGFRAAGGWDLEKQSDIVDTVERSLTRLIPTLKRPANHAIVALSAPTLPLPPLGTTAGVHATQFELQLAHLVSGFLLSCAAFPGVRIVHPQRLNELSPPAGRRDAGLELAADFPYTLTHADALAQILIDLLFPPTPKKGLISDLDDTLWQGILGEVGVDGVAWDLAGHAQVHSIYQQFLQLLAGSGVLIAVASKNEPSLVNQALSRPDLLLQPSNIFPVEAHWGPKSQSVARILQTWNIGQDSVVFIDDSPLELAEVRSQFPGISAHLFPREDAKALVQLFYQLRDLFGKPVLTEEDRIRSASIRASTETHIDVGEAAPDFLRQLEAELTLDYRNNPQDVRAFDLINKTNQFNLNGRRFTQSEWKTFLQHPARFLVTVSYKDRFGPLGKIAVVAGLHKGSILDVSTWVMSCRAFSRQIEYHVLDRLFTHFGVDTIELAYTPTERNGPLQEFLAKFADLPAATLGLKLTRDMMAQAAPDLLHVVHEVTDDQQEVLN
jgi:FkbH-like protein